MPHRVCLILAMLLFASSVAQAGARCVPVPHATEDVAALNAFWGRTVRLCRLPDGSEDAYAEPERGRVMVDQSWLDAIARHYGGWAATGILAHEWGHMVQGDVDGTAAELQADCLAGLFLRGIGQPGSTVEQFAASNHVSGDQHWSMDGHGTSAQRVAAAWRGYRRYAGDRSRVALRSVCPASPR